MYNFTPARSFGRALGAAPRISVPTVGAYAQMNISRKGRHEGRQWRRDGNWDILGLPTALLWLDEMCAASALDPDRELECAAVAADLWP